MECEKEKENSNYYELLKELPNNENERDVLNNLIKRVRSNEFNLKELFSLISAYQTILYTPKTLSPAYSDLLGQMFAQVEANWRSEIFNVVLGSVQVVLLKKLFASASVSESESESVSVSESDSHFYFHAHVHKNNLVFWTGAMKEIRLLSERAKEIVVEWILKQCPEADKSDLPVIFHNLIHLTLQNKILLFKVFEGLKNCLDDDNDESSGPVLLNHFIFLISQNGTLGKLWIKWILRGGCFKISPLVFSGLLSLSQDIEYSETLGFVGEGGGGGGVLFSMIKLIWEVYEETRKLSNDSMIRAEAIDPEKYLFEIAKWIGSDSEAGIRGALQLMKSISEISKMPSMAESFFINLYLKHPFARRELLKSIPKSFKTENWIKLFKLDEFTFKEFFGSSQESVELIGKRAPELLKNVLEDEEQIEEAFEEDEREILNINKNEKKFKFISSDKLKSLIRINSILLPTVLKLLEFDLGIEFDLNIKEFKFNKEILKRLTKNWKLISKGEVMVLKSLINQGQVISSEFEARLVELSELLLVPGGLDAEECNCHREELVQLAIEFVISAKGIYNENEQLKMVSMLINDNNSSSNNHKNNNNVRYPRRICENIMKIIDRNGDWNSFEGTMKFLLERVEEPCEIFYKKCLKSIPKSLEFQVLLAKSICRIEFVELRLEVMEVIAGIALRVVSEPQLSKSLISLLSKKYKETENSNPTHRNFLNNFTEISDHVQIKAIVDFCLKQEIWVKGAREELIRSILMFYGVIEDDSSSTTAGTTAGTSTTVVPALVASKFKNFHLNERSAEFIFITLLTDIQGKLTVAQRLLKSNESLFLEGSDEFLQVWVMGLTKDLEMLTRGLSWGKGALRLHGLLASFYNLCTSLITKISTNPNHQCELTVMKELVATVGGQINRQVYALIPLQQDKIQGILKQDFNLKGKDKGKIKNQNFRLSDTGKSVTGLIYEMERFEEIYIKFVRTNKSSNGWIDKIARSTARDFKIRMEQL